MINLKPDFKPWIADQLGAKSLDIISLTGDASFRSYYRTQVAGQSYIIMLAPPEKERTDAFVHIARAWEQSGIQVPRVFAWDESKGYVLLSDLGDTLLLDVLNAQTVDAFYQQAFTGILQIQSSISPHYMIPPFNEAHMRTELSLFSEWFVGKLLGLELGQDRAMLEAVEQALIHDLSQQPQTVIHRDYHSRNLMVIPNQSLGIIDFQDAMIGPVTYDLVSLLKDCYIQWPQEQVWHWARNFYDRLCQSQPIKVDFNTFHQWFDWTGLQRHLKVLGIFSRLNIRDNKPRYLGDLPRIMKYVLEVTQRYPHFSAFDHWLRMKVVPRLQTCLEAQQITSEEIKVA